MAEKQYLIPYALDVRKRHYHETQQGGVIRFMVQFEVLVQGEWRPVLRYDCAHGYAHCDRFNLQGDQLKDNLNLTYEDALSFADDDIDDQWETYRNNFLMGRFP